MNIKLKQIHTLTHHLSAFFILDITFRFPFKHCATWAGNFWILYGWVSLPYTNTMPLAVHTSSWLNQSLSSRANVPTETDFFLNSSTAHSACNKKNCATVANCKLYFPSPFSCEICATKIPFVRIPVPNICTDTFSYLCEVRHCEVMAGSNWRITRSRDIKLTASRFYA